ncbi:MAG: hypothetical protein ABSH16_03025 [Sedimentisphaerales bacterium]
MKNLITLNFIAAGLLLAATIAFSKFEFGIILLSEMVLSLALVALALANVVAIFVLWRRYRFRAFFPAITFVLSALLSSFGASIGSKIMLKGTPSDPSSFLKGQTKIELENIASRLLNQSFKEIITYPFFPTEIHMISGHRQKEVPPDIQKTLRHYGFQRTFIDDSLSLVKFSHCHRRTWYNYIYTTNEFLPLYSRPLKITEVDIEDWSELIRIAKQGDHATEKEKESIAFTPTIVYPFLKQELGQEFLRCIANYTSPEEITAEQKELVLSALNRQRLVSSRLIENPLITFKKDRLVSSLYWDGTGMGGFWPSWLFINLLDEGVLVYADDGCHLKIKENLSREDQLKIEWLHIGLMNFLYGNLIDKREHHYDRVLGEGWYLNVDK